MADLRFAPEASADLINIFAFSIERFGFETAEAYHDGLEAACQRLTEFPDLGPVYPGIYPPIRCLNYRSHHIFYDIDDGGVIVIRILHHAMNATRHLWQ